MSRWQLLLNWWRGTPDGHAHCWHLKEGFKVLPVYCSNGVQIGSDKFDIWTCCRCSATKTTKWESGWG